MHLFQILFIRVWSVAIVQHLKHVSCFQQPKEKEMRKSLTIVCLLVFSLAAFADQYADVSPYVGPVAPSSPSDVIWDVVQSFDCQMTYSQLQLGAAYAGGYFWVTGGGGSSAVTTDNKYYRFTTAGVLVDSFAQPNNSGWGWRDLAFDGTYLYAGCETATVVAFNPTTGALVPGMDFPKPAAAANVRALAYDPVTDHFWTGNFSSNIIEFDRSGTVIWQGSPSPLAGVYGMAWDANYSAGPTLWIHDQTNNNSCTFWRFNPATHTMTTESHAVPLLPGETSQIAGGAEMSSTYSGGYRVMVGLAQGTPLDKVFVQEMEPLAAPALNVTIVPVGSTVVPSTGGAVNFNISALNGGPLMAYTVWCRVKNPNGTYTAPTVGPVTITTPVGLTVTRNRNQNVPAGWASGMYYEIIYANTSFTYPAIDADSFSFTKSVVAGNGPLVMDATCWGELFPGEVAATPTTSTIMSNYPNPFNPSTTISFTLGNAGNVNLTVYDVNGREVANLVNGYRQAGAQAVTFDGSNLASGVYMYKLNANGQTSIAKMILMK
jgi:hypothetical protein